MEGLNLFFIPTEIFLLQHFTLIEIQKYMYILICHKQKSNQWVCLSSTFSWKLFTFYFTYLFLPDYRFNKCFTAGKEVWVENGLFLVFVIL